MKIVLAPDSFKGTFSATEVCRAMEEGLRRVVPEAGVLSLPLADGGEGTLEVVLGSRGGRTMRCMSLDPLGRELEVEYVMLDSGEAVIEMARSSGLILLAPEERNPWVAGTYGLGMVLKSALDEGATALTLTLGGSATVDGGVGMARALGFRFFDRRGNLLDFEGGRILGKIHKIDKSRADKRLASITTRALCDVTNPLTGPSGAARVFGPQKGADPSMVERLELGLEKLSRRFEKDLGQKAAPMPGAGAAGGLGAAAVAFLGARLDSGIDYILESIGFLKALEDADLVLTGEGSFDSQSLGGKVISGVLSRASERSVPVMIICGRTTFAEKAEPKAGGFTAIERVFSGKDLEHHSRGKLLALTEISDLAEAALRDFVQRREAGPEERHAL